MTSWAIRPRHVHILDILRKEVTIRIGDLAERISVSESTIRRDLDELEEQGLVRRLHGGAMLEILSQVEPPFRLREVSHEKEKDLVGRAAAEWVSDGEVVFLDGGTTTQFIVPHLVDKHNLTVVTCGLNIACALSNSAQVTTILLGGELHVDSQSFAGPLTLEALDAYRMRCDKAFISAGGVSAEFGVTNRLLDRIPIKRRAMEISQKTAIVVDGSKIGVTALGQVAPVDAFDFLITDCTAPAKELEAIAACGPKLVIAQNDANNGFTINCRSEHAEKRLDSTKREKGSIGR